MKSAFTGFTDMQLIDLQNLHVKLMPSIKVHKFHTRKMVKLVKLGEST